MVYTILYVDDEPALLGLGKIFLESKGEFIVDTRLSAMESLEIPEDRSYDAIVSDYQMPDMDGIRFLKEVRAAYGDLPFILFTGRGREEIVIEAINNGVDFYLQKGGQPKAMFSELAHKIKKAVERRQAEHTINALINAPPDVSMLLDTNGTGPWTQYRCNDQVPEIKGRNCSVQTVIHYYSMNPKEYPGTG